MNKKAEPASGAGGQMPEELKSDILSVMSAVDSGISPSENIRMLDSGEDSGESGEPPGPEVSPLGAQSRKPLTYDPMEGVVPGGSHPTHDKVTRISNVRTKVFDIASGDEAAEYSGILEKSMDPTSKTVLLSGDQKPEFVLDRFASRGFRVLTVLKWGEILDFAVPRPGYDVVPSSARKHSASGREGGPEPSEASDSDIDSGGTKAELHGDELEDGPEKS